MTQEQFKSELNKALARMAGANTSILKDKLLKLIEREGAPADYFKFVGKGLYKECYEAVDGWVVKFCSNINCTAEEELIFDEAKLENLDFLFVETIFISLPQPLKMTHLSSESLGSTCFTDMIFQRTAVPSSRSKTRLLQHHPRLYEKNPVRFRNGYPPLSYDEVQALGIADLGWLQKVIELYGDGTFTRFQKFVEDCEIADLHANNTGYINGKPVIFDWSPLITNYTPSDFT